VPRKNNRRDEAVELDPERVRRGAAWVVAAADGTWHVRTVTADGAVKVYRCPGCDHEIGLRMPHVVAWPADDHAPVPYGLGRVAERRHWHTACWNARARRHR
jgi:hypothetical protein